MKICSKCNRINSNKFAYCHACGVKLSDTRCECGRAPNPGDKFCPDCGKKLQPVRFPTASQSL